MKLIDKLKTCLVLLLILSLTTTAIASPGRYIELNTGDKLPWKGWCFDADAMAKIIADKSLADQKCELYTMQELEQQKAKFDLRIGQLNASMDYEINTRNKTIESLKKENLKLEEAIIHNNKFGWVAPSALGFILGGITILLVTL